MSEKNDRSKLKLLPFRNYAGVKQDDPLRFYYWPVIGAMYRRRVELCLAECRGGQRILEIGFGSGVTFLNLYEQYKEIHGLDLNASAETVMTMFKAMNIETYLQNGDVLCMPYPDNFFDTVLLISILEHLKPEKLSDAFREIRRVLKPEGQAIYGVPVERKLMEAMFYLLGYRIRDHHFSTEKDVADVASRVLHKVRQIQMQSIPSLFGPVYETGHFVKYKSGVQK